jgi:fumarylacetoacetase
MMHTANNPALRSWVPVPGDSDFPIQNLPFGICRFGGNPPHVCVAIGDYILDLYALNVDGFLSAFDLPDSVLHNLYLNEFIRLGKTKTSAIRNRISELLSVENEELQQKSDAYGKYLFEQQEVDMLLPVLPGDYTDFYSSEVHATNVGKMFRPDNPLLPNWKHMPIGYHGRSSSIIVSGENFHRPKGQLLPANSSIPVFGQSNQMDFELEMAFITFDGPPLGQHITTAEADEYIFGMVLFNDWSARDIQKWEYVPLGPFLGKNFASNISPWVVTLDALEPFRCAGPQQDPAVLDYLSYTGKKNLDIALEVYITPPNGADTLVSKSNFKHLYWNMNQQLAHHTINGCNIKSGDMYGSGTISAPDESGFGSMMELTWRGEKPLTLQDGSTRKFLLDHDTVTMKGYCVKDKLRIGFGSVVSTVLPAN